MVLDLSTSESTQWLSIPPSSRKVPLSRGRAQVTFGRKRGVKLFEGGWPSDGSGLVRGGVVSEADAKSYFFPHPGLRA